MFSGPLSSLQPRPKLPPESVSSRPYGSFSCRFCGFPEGAFSMASYRSLRGSKGTLGPCRAVCLWLVGLESCWFPCFACIVHSMFSGPVSSLQPRPKLPPILRCRFFESCRLKVFPAVRTGAFRADFVASQKVRFRWLPTGV